MNDSTANESQSNTNSPLSFVLILREHQRKNWQKILSKLPEQRAKLEPIMRHSLRELEPWPDWVLNVAAELSAVDCPKIPKQKFLKIYQLINSLVFGLPVKWIPTTLDFETIPSLCLYLVGHLEKHTERKFAEAEELLGDSPEFVELRQEHHREHTRKVNKILAELAKLNVSFGEAAEKVADARRATFDTEGNPRTTSATNLYRVIFDEWPEVEMMSGIKQLTIFLDPHLGVRDWEQKYELVKKLSGRLEIAYRPELSRDIQGT